MQVRVEVFKIVKDQIGMLDHPVQCLPGSMSAGIEGRLQTSFPACFEETIGEFRLKQRLTPRDGYAPTGIGIKHLVLTGFINHLL